LSLLFQVDSFLGVGYDFLLRVLTSEWKGSEYLLTEIRIRKGETLDRALRRLKKRLDRENVIKDARNNRYYEKPSVRKRRKMKVAKFTQMLKTRYADV
jgi:small subunit ribosomal protein S21